MAHPGMLAVEVPGEAHPLNIAYSETGNRNGPLMLFVHGLGVWRKTWIETVKHPSYASIRRRFRCVAIDLPGFGDSGVLKGTHCIEEMAVVILRVVEKLTDKKAILVGHSLGGSIVLTVGLDHPECVRAVVSLGSPIASEDFRNGEPEMFGLLGSLAAIYPARMPIKELIQIVPIKAFNLVRVANPFREVTLERLKIPGELARLSRIVWVALDGARKHDKRAYVELIYDLLYTNDLQERLGGLRVPLLVVDGFPAFAPVDTLEAIDGLTENVPFKRVVRIEGSGHLTVFIEIEKSAEVLTELLDELEAFEAAQEK